MLIVGLVFLGVIGLGELVRGRRSPAQGPPSRLLLGVAARRQTCASGSRCSSARASSSGSSAEVDPALEVTEIVDRTVKAGGPALLFERPRGASTRCS